jgi:hypothetical protein
MAEQATAERFRSLKAFKEFEQRTPVLGEPGGAAAASPAAGGQVSPLRVLSFLEARGAAVPRSEVALELHASPESIESAVLRLLKEELISIQPGPGPDDLIAAR